MQVLTNALRVLECVVLAQPVGVSEVARQLDLPKSSVQRALTSLEGEGWLARDERQHGLWVQTPRLWVLAHQGKDVGVAGLARPSMRWLWEQTNENIHLTQQQGDELLVVDKIESTHSVRVFDPIGTKIPLHVSASGKALLAARSAEGLEAYLGRSLARFTEESLTEEAVLRGEIVRIQSEGYSFNRGEWRSEISGVGVALDVGEEREAEYGLAISVPTHRLAEKLIPQYGALLVQARARVAEAAGVGSVPARTAAL